MGTSRNDREWIDYAQACRMTPQQDQIKGPAATEAREKERPYRRVPLNGWSGFGFNSNERARLEGRKHFNEPGKQRAKLLNSIAVRHENRNSYW
jgi:hypothetical protein